jgi:hypothetical protein
MNVGASWARRARAATDSGSSAGRRGRISAAWLLAGSTFAGTGALAGTTLALATLTAAPAGAASAGTLVVAPAASGLYSGDAMWVSDQNGANGSPADFTPGAVVTLYECEGSYNPALGTRVDTSFCDTGHAVATTANSDGSLSSTYMTFEDPLVTQNAPGGYDCSSGCHILADDPPPDAIDAMTQVHGDNACNGHTGAPYQPSTGFGPAVKTVTVTEPDGSSQHYTTTDASTQGTEFFVNQGAKLAVTITWDHHTFSGSNVDQVWDCVYSSTSPWSSPYGSGTNLGTPPDSVLKPAPNSGTFTTSYTINQTVGTTVCDRGRVSGMPVGGTGNDGTEKSAQLCFTVEMPAVTPEVASVLLLPASAGIVGFGAFLLVRRRRAKASTP